MGTFPPPKENLRIAVISLRENAEVEAGTALHHTMNPMEPSPKQTPVSLNPPLKIVRLERASRL